MNFLKKYFSKNIYTSLKEFDIKNYINNLLNFINKNSKKFITLIYLIYYLSLYFLLQFKIYMTTRYVKESYVLEIRSFLITFFLAFLFYYLVVIELSILIWGYSLLCYWFLFIITFLFLIYSWRLEVSYIKNELSLDKTNGIYFEFWVWYYKNKTPFSFFDYMTNYYWKKSFYYTVINPNLEKIEEGWEMKFLYFFFIIFFSFYFCVYRFDPRFVKFVARYFQPIVSFEESWANPWLEDIFSAPILTRNDLVDALEYLFRDNPTALNILSKVPKPTEMQQMWADFTYENKNSLRTSARFSDIFFLWEVKKHEPLKALVFGSDTPMVLSTKFDQSKDILFLWYITSEFNKNHKTFWSKNFQDDQFFWNYINHLKKNLEEKLEENRLSNEQSYVSDNVNWTTFYELLLAENYMNTETFPNQRNSELLGKNLDLYEPLVNKKAVKKLHDIHDTFSIFTTNIKPPVLVRGKTLFKEIWRSSGDYSLKDNFDFNYNLLKDNLSFLLKKKSLPTLNDIFTSLESLDDVELDLYRDFIKGSQPSDILNVTILKTNKLRMRKLMHSYDTWLSLIEKELKLKPWPFSKIDYKNITWGWFIYLLYVWVFRIEQTISPTNILSQLSVYLPDKLQIWRFRQWNFKPSRSLLTMRRKKNWKKKKPLTRVISKKLLKKLLKFEYRIRKAERFTRLWSGDTIQSSKLIDRKTFSPLHKEWTPWFSFLFNLFSQFEDWMVMPGFVRFYQPTPYPSTFSTFGHLWFNYQLYQLKVTNYVIAESNTLLTALNTIPFIMYTNVEAILYLRPLVDWICTIGESFVRLLAYPLEFFTNISKTTGSLLIIFHLTWFIHYYIYALVAAYLFFRSLKYAYRAYYSSWAFETAIDTIMLVQHTNFVYWHSMNQIWSNYKTPEQLLTFKLHTLTLLNLSTQNHLNYFTITRKSYEPLVNIFLRLPKYSSLLLDKESFELNKDKFYKTDFHFMKSFFEISTKKYTSLMHKGGSDVNTDTLVWNYFNYLSQVSIFISRGLWKNKYKISEPNLINSLIKQFVVSMSSNSLSENSLFLIAPLLDNSLNWKLLKNLVFNISLEHYSKQLFCDEEFDWILKNNDALNYITLKSKIYELITLNTSSNQEIYSIINSIPSFISKLNIGSIWDNKMYWLIIFFRSFRFIPRHKYPYINFHPSYEYSWNILSKSSHSNSWINHSLYSWPFFTLTQHIWWSSFFGSKPKSLVNSTYETNSITFNNIDQVWNFQEKWYSKSQFLKTETIFGVVRSLNFPTYYSTVKHGTILNYDSNFDLSYDEKKLSDFETYRSYNKTNPPIDCSELGINPSFLINLFSDLGENKIHLFLSFFDQLQLILKGSSKKEFDPLSLDLYEMDSDMLKQFEYVDPELLSEHDFYTKKYQYLLKQDHLNVLNNWIFGFDTSYFLNFFASWDYFNTELNNLWPNKLNFKENLNLVENLISIFSLEDMNSELTSNNHFLKKPVGALDKAEMFILKKHQFLKSIDYLSITRKKESPFKNIDWEFLISQIGQATRPDYDIWTVAESYDEDYFGFWYKWSSYNAMAIKNTVGPLILGWVGELYNNTNSVTSFYFSLLYTSNQLKLENHKIWIGLVDYDVDEYFSWKIYSNSETFRSYFGIGYHKKYLQSQAYSWTNLFLTPYNNRYFFGIKSNARLDYWSWKCGYQIDYKNGFFSSRPYLGTWFSLGTWLSPYDSIFGFYRSYRQMDNDMNYVDESTDVLHVMFEGTEDMAGNKPIDPYTFEINAPENWAIRDLLTQSFWEIFFCFQHPFFLGYFVFWFLTNTSVHYDLGLVNFSPRWSIRWTIVKKTYFKKTLNNIFKTNTWTSNENWTRKVISRYWMYWINPIHLTTQLSYNFTDDVSENSIKSDKLYNFFTHTFILYDFFKNQLKLKNFEVWTLLNFTKWSLNLIRINWLSTDIPFTLNPYIVEPYYSNKFFKTNYDTFYFISHFKFSHYDSLRENFNLNNLIDWSGGSYLDVINLSFYFSSYRITSWLPGDFIEDPIYLAAGTFANKEDDSYSIAVEQQRASSTLYISNIILGDSIMMHNMSILMFLNNTILYSAWMSLNLYEFSFAKFFLDFYLYEAFDQDLDNYDGLKVLDYSRDQLSLTWDTWDIKAWFLHALYAFNLDPLNNFDLTNIWLRSSITFSNKYSTKLLFESIKYKFYSRIKLIKNFYYKIGHYIWLNFF